MVTLSGHHDLSPSSFVAKSLESYARLSKRGIFTPYRTSTFLDKRPYVPVQDVYLIVPRAALQTSTGAT